MGWGLGRQGVVMLPARGRLLGAVVEGANLSWVADDGGCSELDMHGSTQNEYVGSTSSARGIVSVRIIG